MLYNRLMEKKTFEDRYDEGLSQIPLYCSEWTNFNASDPGITILEAISLFETVQQDHIDELPQEVNAKLLKMAGFEPIKGKAARVLLKCEGLKNTIELRQGQTFALGDVTYELVHNTVVENCSIIGLYSRSKGEVIDRNFVLDKEVLISAKIFNDAPQHGDEILFICDNLPSTDGDIIFYASCESGQRNPFEEKKRDLFARLRWEVYTTDGFVEMNAIDYTGGFLVDGEIRFRIPADKNPAIYDELPKKGYCIRGILEYANYDLIPKLTAIDGFLFEACQRQTKSYVKTNQKNDYVTIDSVKAAESYITVFVREEKGQPYRAYSRSYGQEQGRFFDIVESEGKISYYFNKEKYGFGPLFAKDAIRVLVYDEDTMRNYKLGKVLGYDNQLIELPFKNVVKESLSLVAKYTKNGEELYEFVRVGHDKDEDLDYTIDEQNGILSIRNAGRYIGAELLIGSCAITMGADGNVRANNTFIAKGLPSSLKFTNPNASCDGRSRESTASVRKRFLEDIETSAVAVCEQDYENLILTTPGLCIKKARAIQDSSKNQVKLVALVDDGGKYPRLSEAYKSIILDRINEHRLLCTKVTMVEPEFVPVNLIATIYVKPHFEDKKAEIEKLLERELDFVSSDNRFGDILSYEDIFRKIEKLPYVAYVYDLRLALAKANLGTVVDQDIVPVKNGLIVPQSMNIELLTYYEK